MSTTLRIFVLLAGLAAAGCTGDRMLDPFADFKWSGFGIGGDRDRDRTQQPPPNMAGRWLLSSPNRGQCGMNFSGGAKATEGTIAPEGGCPGRFYTSRRWTLENGNVIIRDHNGEQLAQLQPAMSGGGWFEGQASTGERVMLSR
jgi:hypothetical protein